MKLQTLVLGLEDAKMTNCDVIATAVDPDRGPGDLGRRWLCGWETGNLKDLRKILEDCRELLSAAGMGGMTMGQAAGRTGGRGGKVREPRNTRKTRKNAGKIEWGGWGLRGRKILKMSGEDLRVGTGRKELGEGF